MTYAVKDKSTHDGAPIECYAFVGSYGSYYYTSYHSPITVAGIDFTPLPIVRTALETGTIVDSITTMDFIVPFNIELVQRYAMTLSPRELDVTVYRVHEGDDYATDYQIEWNAGGVVEFTTSGARTTISTGNKFQTRLNGNISAAFFQRLCNHVYGDERCKIDPESYKTSATVTKVQGQIITVASDGWANNALIGGHMVIDRTGEKQGIIVNTDDVLRIGVVPLDIVIGDTVSLYRGCNHLRLGDCKGIFNNVDNYGGFDFIPLKNPYVKFNKTTSTSTTKTAKDTQVADVKKASYGMASASY